MKLFSFLSILFLFNFFSCKQGNLDKSNATVKSAEEIKAEQKELALFGISSNPNNILGGLQVGDTAPDFELTNQDGNLMSLSNQLVYSDVLVVFYRGYWCPICNRHLAAFEQELASLKNEGISILAITPDDQGAAQIVTNKNELTFPILSDTHFEVITKYKGLFHRKDKEEEKLPIPATYLIGQDRKIKYVHYNPDYTKRSSIADIIGAKTGK